MRTVRAVILGALLLLIITVALGAQDYTISRTVFIPSVYYVGDRVELRLTLRSALLDQIQLPQELPQPAWGTIHDIRIIDRGDEKDIRILFTSYYPGTRTLPAINLGPILLSDISIFVSSILTSNEQDLVPSRDQLILPGTQLIIILWSLLVLSVPLLWLVIFRWGRQYFAQLIARYREGLPYRRLVKSLRELTENAGAMDGRNFYIALLDLVREYLTGRIRVDARSATTRELEFALKKEVDNPSDRNFIVRLFHHGDLVKFASQPSTLKSRMDHLTQLQEVLEHIETSRSSAQSEPRRSNANRRSSGRRGA
jgi:hypothetical protein